MLIHSLPLTRTVPRCGTRPRAFTLVEIMIVVVILGLLAVAVIGTWGDSRTDSMRSVFVSDQRTFAEAAILYRAKTGDFLPDGGSGQLPPGFADYIDERAWLRPTSIGGVWDSEYNEMGITSAVGVHFDGTGDTQDDTFMTVIDSMLDDGDLATGVFRKLDADRYYYVIAD